MPKVTFQEERCKGCGLCLEICPMRIISFGDKLNLNGYHPATIEEDKKSMCIGCASCGKICPDCAITVER